jgi:hypothetical protein
MLSPKRCVLKDKQNDVSNKDKTMDNVQKHNICTNAPSSQSFRSGVRMLVGATGFLFFTLKITMTLELIDASRATGKRNGG